MSAPVGHMRSTFCMRTGVAHLRSLPSSQLLDLALQRADPEVLVTPILHEIIHHACANTAVNVAMQYRWLELLRLLLSSPAFGYGIHEEHVALAADLAAAEAVLQPIAEGLAHFAEFDCALPQSRMQRPYMLGPSDALLWRLVSLKQGADAHIDSLCALQRAELLDARTIDRKTNVLCNPIRPATGNDSYLLGYLAVKSLWNRFVAAGPGGGLRAPSFLNFVSYYVYEDWSLATILMSPGPIPLAAMTDRIDSRLRSLFAGDIAARVAAFTADMAARGEQRGTLTRGPEEREHGAFEGLDLTSEEVWDGMRALVRFQSERVGPAGAITEAAAPAGIVNLQHQTLMATVEGKRILDLVLDLPQQKRAFCFLMDVPVDIRGRGGAELLLSPQDDPSVVRGLQAPAGRFSSEPQPGRLFGVVASTAIPWRLYCFLLHGDEIVCSWTHGEPAEDPGELQRLARAIVNEAQMEGSLQLSFSLMNDYLTRNAAVQTQVEATAGAATSAVASRLRALLDAAGWTGLIGASVTRDFGLRNLVPTMKGVRGLAAAGLCNTFTSDRGELGAMMQGAGHPLADVLELSARIRVETGVTLVRADESHVHVQV